MKRSSEIKGLAIIVLFIVIVIALVGIFGLAEKLLSKMDEDFGDGYSAETDARISMDGIWYREKKNLETVLLMGIDSISGTGEGKEDSQQADFLALLVVDKSAETFRILHLNRDTMANIPRMDLEGKKIGTYRGQLTLAHTCGTTDKQRCRSTVDVVEDLLYGIRIDHYVSLTMDAVAIVNDSIGGVTVQLLDDFSFIDPAFVKDAVVTLKGEQALQYVRERGALEDSSNLRRMERQRQYIGELLKQYTDGQMGSTDDVMKTVMDISTYMVSDYTADQLSRLFERISAYQYEGVFTVEGESVISADGYMEYHADEADIQRKVVQFFYEPETVQNS